MKIQAKCLLLTTLLSSVVILPGCVSPGKGMIPQGGDMSVAQIYKQETGMSMSSNNNQDHTDSGVHRLSDIRQGAVGSLPTPSYVAYTSTSKNEIDSLFKRLPNPEVPMYVYPHLVHLNGEAYPKPGMTSAFFLYRSNHFAMPTEVY